MLNKLLSENWNDYVAENKISILMLHENLVNVLSDFKMQYYNFEISETYVDMDSSLATSTFYKLEYDLPNGERVVISIGRGHPTVEIDEVNRRFEDYFHINAQVAYELANLFLEFAKEVKAKF